jgi:hypothetical protein
VLVLIAPVLFLAIIHTLAAAPTCNDTPDGSSFHLIAIHETAFEEQSATPEEMDVIAAKVRAPAEARKAHPLMLILAQAGSDVELEHQPLELRDANGNAFFCDAPTSIVVHLGVFKRRVILYHDAAGDACVRSALLDHYLQHSHVLDEVIDQFVDEHRARFAGALYDLTQKTAPDPGSAIQNLEAGLASLIGSLYREFESEVERTRMAADTPAELEKLRLACGGKLQRLEREFGLPGDRHAARQTLRSVSLQ